MLPLQSIAQPAECPADILADRPLPDKRLVDILDVLEFCSAWCMPATVVYRWVWCEFPSKPSSPIRNALKAAGFRWNKRRSLDGNCSIWQHNCGVRTKPARGYDPRDKYGQIGLDEALRNFTRESA